MVDTYTAVQPTSWSPRPVFSAQTFVIIPYQHSEARTHYRKIMVIAPSVGADGGVSRELVAGCALVTLYTAAILIASLGVEISCAKFSGDRRTWATAGPRVGHRTRMSETNKVPRCL